MADRNTPPPAVPANFVNDPWFLWVRQQIVDLQLQNKDQQNKLDEIDSCFELRELATRLDRVIVKDLLAAVGPLELVPPGVPVVVTTVSGVQLYNLLDCRYRERVEMLPPGMGLGTLGAIGGVLSSLKMRGDSFAHDRVFDDVKLQSLMDQVFPYIDGCGTGQYGRLLLQWIHDNYSDYLKSGSKQALEDGEQIPFHRLKEQAGRA